MLAEGTGKPLAPMRERKDRDRGRRNGEPKRGGNPTNAKLRDQELCTPLRAVPAQRLMGFDREPQIFRMMMHPVLPVNSMQHW